ncbi:hypothetical protein AVEN_24670-1 [Araneus ventricosus]|uniref:Uncharacterized protein n=1 Tax=Araneus ventricosus TaxID=182803 RepID=A0A4Y2QU95_ARAVE|nr:hypothetical protein AVEN_24670-1 [Araneus ventricosus]
MIDRGRPVTSGSQRVTAEPPYNTHADTGGAEAVESRDTYVSSTLITQTASPFRQFTPAWPLYAILLVSTMMLFEHCCRR